MGKLFLLIAIAAVFAPMDSFTRYSTTDPRTHSSTASTPELSSYEGVECNFVRASDYSVGPSCPVTCNEPNRQFCSFVPLVSGSQCRCKDGYIRLSYREPKCVLKENCPSLRNFST